MSSAGQAPESAETVAQPIDSNEEEIEGDEYPTQHHAGKVGLGPQFDKGGGLSDKVKGLTHQVVGKISHNPEKVQNGKDQASGELARKEREEDMNEDPFSKPKDNADTNKSD